MEGKVFLNALQESIKEQIVAKYGSLDDFYNLVFNLTVREFNAFVRKDNTLVKAIEDYSWKISNDLEDMGVMDGRDLYNFLSQDAAEYIKNSICPPLTPEQNTLLKRIGIDPA